MRGSCAEADLRAEARASGAEGSKAVIASSGLERSDKEETTDPLGRATGPF